MTDTVSGACWGGPHITHYRADEEPEYVDRWTSAKQDDENFVSRSLGELWSVYVVAGHGYVVTDQPRNPIGRHLVCFCGGPIINNSRGLLCEFESYEDWVRPADHRCECNWCLLDREPATKPKVYCSTKCRDRMRLAMNRVKRRAEGKKTRVTDELADPIAEFVYENLRNR